MMVIFQNKLPYVFGWTTLLNNFLFLFSFSSPFISRNRSTLYDTKKPQGVPRRKEADITSMVVNLSRQEKPRLAAMTRTRRRRPPATTQGK